MSAAARCASTCRSTSSSPIAFFGQLVIVTKDFDARQRVAARLKKVLRDDFVGIDGFVHPLDLGPPVGRPIQYRLSGPDIQTVRGLALKFADVMARQPQCRRHRLRLERARHGAARRRRPEPRPPARRQLAGHRHHAEQRGRRLVGDADVRQHLHHQRRGPRRQGRARGGRDLPGACRSPAATASRFPCRRSPTSSTRSSSRWSGAATASRPSPCRPAS